MSKIFIPLAWVMGVEWHECEDVAQLIGLKTIVNEFVAYEHLGKLKSANKLSVRQVLIALLPYPDIYLPTSRLLVLQSLYLELCNIG
jgi:Nucleoside permease